MSEETVRPLLDAAAELASDAGTSWWVGGSYALKLRGIAERRADELDVCLRWHEEYDDTVIREWARGHGWSLLWFYDDNGLLLSVHATPLPRTGLDVFMRYEDVETEVVGGWPINTLEESERVLRFFADTSPRHEKYDEHLEKLLEFRKKLREAPAGDPGV